MNPDYKEQQIKKLEKLLNINAKPTRSADKELTGAAAVITHNKKKVAYLKPVKKNDWRKQCIKKPKLLVSMDELIKPVEDIWEDYI